MTLPGALERLISRLEAGQVELKLAGSRPRRECSGAPCGYQDNFSWLLMFAASLAGGIFLLVEAHLSLPGWFCLGLAGLSMLKLLVRDHVP